MLTHVKIKTPKGYAKKIEWKLRPFLIGIHQPKEIKTNKDDSEIVWTIEAPVRRILKINRNVALFDSLMTNVMQNRKVKKRINKHLDKDQQQELDEMLFKHTEVKIVKH